MSKQFHAPCKQCGGSGCEVCHDGWECTMDIIGECNKCAMGWPIGGKKND